MLRGRLKALLSEPNDNEKIGRTLESSVVVP